MEQLSSLDAQFLAMEDAGSYGHAGFFVVCDPAADDAAPTREDVCRRVAERIHLVPPYTRKLAQVPFRLDHPYWVKDPDFDAASHVRESTVEPPGNPRAVAEHVARIIATPLERSRPLWELHLIHGLEDGKIGLVHKFHHALADGISGVQIMDVFVDSSPEGDEPTRDHAGRHSPGDPPSRLEMLTRALTAVPRQSVRALRSAPTALPNLTDVPGASAIPGVSALQRLIAPLTGTNPATGDIQGPPPRTRFNRKLPDERRFAYGTVSLATLKAVKNRSEVTFNDVVVAICAGGLRRWLLELGELPDAPLRALVPVSVRTGEEQRAFGNRISAIVVALPTDEPDPRRRLELAHDALTAAKRRQRALPPGLLTDAGNFIPPMIFTQASRMTAEVSARLAPPVNLIVSNIPGPTEPLYWHRARVESYHPFTVIMDGVGLNMTAMSYLDGVGFGMVSGSDDLWPLMEGVSASLEELAS
jgi:WS/DGAT/MGAT family acyltransferase